MWTDIIPLYPLYLSTLFLLTLPIVSTSDGRPNDHICPSVRSRHALNSTHFLDASPSVEAAQGHFRPVSPSPERPYLFETPHVQRRFPLPFSPLELTKACLSPPFFPSDHLRRKDRSLQADLVCLRKIYSVVRTGRFWKSILVSVPQFTSLDLLSVLLRREISRGGCQILLTADLSAFLRS